MTAQKFASLLPNNSFKPKLLRYINGVAEKACHAVDCATQFGLTQALGLFGERSVDDRGKTWQRLPGQLVVIAISALFVGLAVVLALIIALRLGSLWAILLLPLAIPAAFVVSAIIVRHFASKSVTNATISAKQA